MDWKPGPEDKIFDAGIYSAPADLLTVAHQDYRYVDMARVLRNSFQEALDAMRVWVQARRPELLLMPTMREQRESYKQIGAQVVATGRKP